MTSSTPSNNGPLSYLDWRIVEIAREDGRWSLNPDGLLPCLASLIFRFEIPRPLANERQEALRRFAVRAWYWDLIRIGDMASLIDAGFSPEHARQILAHVAASRGFTPSVQDCLV
jgi:hypothetical protein